MIIYLSQLFVYFFVKFVYIFFSEEIEVEIEAAFVVSACATHLDDAGKSF